MSTLARTSPGPYLIAIRRFGAHFVEMCIVMCAGGGTISAAIFGLASVLGYPALVRDATVLAVVLIVGAETAAMAGYMALRRHPARHNIEMSGSTVVGGIAFVVLAALGGIPDARLASWLGLFMFMCGPLCVLMLAVMVVRFDHYGGRVSLIAAAATAVGDYTCSMHPEVRRAEPGSCPVCGMTLVRR